MGEMAERVAAAIANRRAGRRGAPAVSNVLDVLKMIKGGKLYDEVMDDARAAIEEMREPTDAMTEQGAPHVCRFEGAGPYVADDVWRAMIDAALKP